MEPIVDTDLVFQHKRRALTQNAENGIDFLMTRSAEDLADRLSTVSRHFPRTASLFSLTGHAAQTLHESGKAGEVRRVEADRAFFHHEEGMVAPFETVPFEPESLDLIVSLLSLHEANDVPGVLVQIRRALAPDGLFLAALPGAGTLQELRDCLLQAEVELSGGASPHVLPFADVRDMGALLQRAGFTLPVADLETLTVRYDNLFALMRDLRAMGAANALLARARKPTSRAVFLRAAELYQERYSDPDGRIRATFAIVWLSGWAPHQSQQKPAPRGSATASLADALKAN